MKALKPCPFCGGEAELERAGDRQQSTIYACLHCSCRLETGEEWGYGADWNRRAPDPRIAELEARAVKAENVLADEREGGAIANRSVQQLVESQRRQIAELEARAEKAEAERDAANQQADNATARHDALLVVEREHQIEIARLRAEGTFNEGIEAATKWIVERRDNYTEEHGSFDWETGATEFGSSAKEDYVAELDEIEEGLRSLRRPDEGGA